MKIYYLLIFSRASLCSVSSFSSEAKILPVILSFAGFGHSGLSGRHLFIVKSIGIAIDFPGWKTIRALRLGFRVYSNFPWT